MKLTKYEHACFTLEKDEQMIVVDPGAFTTDIPALENVTAVVITHVHQDHFDPNAIEAIFSRNPNIVLYSPKQVDDTINGAFTHTVVSAGDVIKHGPFTLEFFGGKHAVIHESFGQDENVGVMINDAVYYPGDSFTQPEKPVRYLALPTAAPWMKVSEAIDFVYAVKPAFAFPTHDAISSDAGKMLADQMIGAAVQKSGGTYQRLIEPIEI